MSDYRRAQVPGAAYFFTVTTFGRQPLLAHGAVRSALRNAIRQVRESLPFTIDGWVLLPDHMHCIWQLPEGDANFSKRWGIIKRQVTRELTVGCSRTPSQARRHEGGLWQRRFWEHLIRDDDDYRRHLDYLHWNPVKHGYVKRVAEWPYSSFHRYVKMGVLPLDWGGDDDVLMDGNFGE